MAKYVLATDGTETSRGSEDYVSEILDPDNAVIHVINVIDSFDEEKLSEISFSIDMEELRKRHEEKAEKILEPVGERLKKSGFKVNTEFVHGNPGKVICRRAEELGADGIFMGRGRHSRLGEMFYGSVSHYVVLNANTSVTLTPINQTEDQ